ncbi:DHA2 family efflux MFS transporter permease subunit [Gilvimarinus sp. F26214L]|uniref:DHA2 family efflux MFS transporter permease subunit n=1 Tax=Gilvimarinus sp. DZF01 TaxID=3461371 RepID=UPI004045F6B6
METEVRTTPAAAETGGHNRALVTLSVMAATIMQTIDTTIANVALPQMQGSMGVFQDQISWVLTSYILAAAIFIPLTGHLVARLGRKRLFIICVVGFTLTSMLCGAAQNIYQIVFFRFLQGVFGAPLVPLSQSVMLDIYPREKHGSAMAMWGMGVMLGPIIGPTLGGYLTEYYSWRWVFYINLPLGLVTWAGLTMFLRETPLERDRRFDLLGFTLLAVAIGALQMMLDRGESQNWFASAEIVIEALLAALFFYLFIAHMLTSKRPFLDPALFRDRNFNSGMVLMFVVGIILLAVLALMPPFMQNLMGYPTLDVGLLLAPRGMGTMLGMMLMGRIVGRVDPRVIIFAGLMLLAWSLWDMSRFTAEVASREIVTSGVIQGLGLGCIFVPMATVTFATLAPRYRNEATPLYNLVRNLGSSIGVSISITLLAQNSQSNQAVFSEFITPFNLGLRELAQNTPWSLDSTASILMLNGEVSRQAAVLAYLQDFRYMMWLTIAAVPLLLLIRVPRDPSTN